jgi:hypothetical protein
MNANEREWEALSGVWRTAVEEVDREPLHRLIAAERRRLVGVVIGEMAMLAGFAWMTWLFVRDGVEVWEAVWLSTIWMFTAVAIPFAWWNRRGAWRSLADSVADCLRQRAARRLRTLRFACGLFVAEVVAVVAELAWFDRVSPRAIGILAVLTAGFLGWIVWMRTRDPSATRRP